MDDRNTFIHDAYISMAERTIKRLWVLIVLLVILLVASNLTWLHYESQFTDEETTTIDSTQDGDGINIVGGGNITYEPTSENYQN